MNIKYIIKLCAFFISLFLVSKIFSLERKELILLTKNIINLYEESENRTLSKSETLKIEQDFYDIKEIVQNDLKSGNKSVSIDIYLFLNGLINNDISSLQSLIISNNIEYFPKDLAQLISYKVAKKLSFALKENKVSHKTKINIIKNSNQNKCHVYLNGVFLGNNLTLSIPAGIPFYLSLFCQNDKFEVKYIKSFETQSKLNVYFDNIKKIEYSLIEIRRSIPNSQKNKLNSINECEKKMENSDESNISNFEKLIINEHCKVDEQKTQIKSINKNFSFGSGVAINKDFGYIHKIGAKQFNFPTGIFITSTSFIKFNEFLLTFDIAKLRISELKPFIIAHAKDSNFNQKYAERKSQTFYIRPAIGFEKSLIQLTDNSSLYWNFLVNYAKIFSNQNSIRAQGVGIQSAIGTSYKFTENFIWDINFGGSYTFGSLSGFQLNTTAHLSFQF
ncbi:hypothetical protein [Fluviispira multicolorata]|uniref:Uncharacterized protein n=1 Tax=Fluviispira multicolorata TaxID=2654512 RepID=A0A833JC76_9BACT|nr:hypothetical protein [Fluviispira multicolorata]KAB8029118.1 hypothetical protein GCL57_11300 [Fluviispira multicolorata]